MYFKLQRPNPVSILLGQHRKRPIIWKISFLPDYRRFPDPADGNGHQDIYDGNMKKKNIKF